MFFLSHSPLANTQIWLYCNGIASCTSWNLPHHPINFSVKSMRPILPHCSLQLSHQTCKNYLNTLFNHRTLADCEHRMCIGSRFVFHAVTCLGNCFLHPVLDYFFSFHFLPFTPHFDLTCVRFLFMACAFHNSVTLSELKV